MALNTAVAYARAARAQWKFRISLSTVLFAGLISFLIFGPLAFGAVEAWAMLAQQLIAAALVALWAIAQWNGRAKFHGSPLFLPVAALGVLIAAQIAFNASAYRNATLLAALEAVVYAATIFLVAQTVVNRERLKAFALTLTIFGAALATEAILFGLASPGRLYGLRAPRAAGIMYGPYVNHNHYAGLMEMLVAFPLVAAFRQNLKTSTRFLYALATFVMAASIVLSGSRGGMIAFAAELGCVCFIAIGRGSGKRLGRAVVAGLLLLAIFVAWYDSGRVSAALGSLRHPEISTETRRQIAADALHMAMAHPVTGWGLGTFVWVHPQFRSFFTDVPIHAAHNDFAQALAELGFPGFAALAWLLVIVFCRGFHRLKDWETDSAAGAQLGAAIGAGGLLLHGLSDFNLQVPANATMFFALCAIVCVRREQGPSGLEHRQLAVFALLALGVMFAAASVLSFREQRLVTSSDPATLRRSAQLNRFDALPWLRLGHVELSSGNSEAAEHDLEQAVRLNSHDPRAWLELAQAQSTMADDAGARNSLAMALKNAPSTPKYIAAAASLYFEIGEQQLGLAQLRTLTEHAPGLMPASVELAWRATHNVQIVMRDVTGGNMDAEFALLQGLIDRNDLASAKQVWAGIAREHPGFDAKQAFPYLQFAIEKDDPAEAAALWRAITAQPTYTVYRTGDNLVVNSGFEAPALNAGLDWRYKQTPNVNTFLDPNVAHSGERSLAMVFQGEVSDTGIMQYVLVKPGTSYHLGGYFQSKGLDGAGGLQWQVVKNDTSKLLGETPVLMQASVWQGFGADFTTGPETRIVVLRLARVPEGNVVTGQAWFDDLSLIAK